MKADLAGVANKVSRNELEQILQKILPETGDLSIGGVGLGGMSGSGGRLSPANNGGRRALLSGKPLKDLKCLSCEANLTAADLRAGDPVAWDALPEMKPNPVSFFAIIMILIHLALFASNGDCMLNCYVTTDPSFEVRKRFGASPQPVRSSKLHKHWIDHEVTEE